MLLRKKGGGIVLTLGLFLVFFAATIFAISFVYVKRTVDEIKSTKLNIFVIPMHEIYYMKLIDLVNEKVYPGEDTDHFLSQLNFIFLNHPTNSTQIIQCSIDEVDDDLSESGLVESTEGDPDSLSYTRKIKIKKDETIDFIGENGEVVYKIKLNLSSYYARRGNFENTFTASQEEIRGYIYDYFDKFFAKNSNDFLRNLFCYEKGSSAYMYFKVDKNKIKVKDNSGKWDVVLPYSVKYVYREKKKEYFVDRDYILIFKLKPTYLINVYCEIRRGVGGVVGGGVGVGSSLFTLRFKGSAAIEIEKLEQR